jgi:hypothetical protein
VSSRKVVSNVNALELMLFYQVSVLKLPGFLGVETFRVKSVIEEIELDEGGLLEDLYSADRKFAEYYNVC